MTYTKFYDPWLSSYNLTGEALNHIESQWTAIKADADAHNHNSRYYLKATADATFFTLSSSVSMGFDADLLDGSHYSNLVAAVMPIGAIMILSGDVAPAGWAICNGGSGTPDLRNLFIIGAGDTYAQGATGGAFSTAISGSFTVGSHAITNDEMPIHTHTYDDYSNGIGSSYTYALRASCCGSETSRTPNTGNTGGASGHSHSGNSITLNNLTCTPKYYPLYYIMKVS